MKLFKYENLLIVLLLMFVTSLSYAATCGIPRHNNVSLGDTVYSPKVCSQTVINKFWTDFNFDKSDWDDGFGYFNVCNINVPLNKTFSALWLLQNSTTNPASSISDFSGDFLRWAYNYSARAIEELDGRCGNGSTSGVVATTHRGALVNDRTELKFPFFYGQGMPERAGTIVHEARHADGISHDSCNCPRGGSCDQRWGDRKANDYGILYMWWFVDSGVNTTTAMKRRAQNRVNNVLAGGFCESTTFRINYGL